MESTVIAAKPPEDAAPSGNVVNTTRRIFISYAREDQKFARRLAHDLREKIANVWIDVEEIQDGDDWPRRIDEAIRNCTEFVLILSPASRASEIVENELNLARHLGAAIRPVLYLSCDPWILIGTRQYIDFTESYDEGLKKLLTGRVPVRALSRRLRILLKKYYRAVLGAIAVSLSIAASIYSLSPSRTSFIVSGGEKPALTVRIRNDGGRPSVVLASSFKLDFGRLPIEPEPLVPLQPERDYRIAGHTDVKIELTADRMLTPAKKDEESYFNKKDVEPLLKGGKVLLTAQVRESDGGVYTLSQHLSADSIRRFILEAFPNDVPGQPLP
jgi:hypothetical protein